MIYIKDLQNDDFGVVILQQGFAASGKLMAQLWPAH